VRRLATLPALLALIAACAHAAAPPHRAQEPNEAIPSALRGGDVAPAPETRASPASGPATSWAPSTQPATQPAEAAEEDAGLLAGLITAVRMLAWYFGPIGIASVAAWLLVWALLAVLAARTKGMAICLGAGLLVGLAIVYARTLPGVGPFVAFLIWLAAFAALAVVVLWAVLRKEIPAAFLAMILSLVAFGLAMWNSDNVSAIEEDRTAEIEAARRRQIEARRTERQKEIRKLRGKAADIRFAEDDANDVMDLAGYRKAEAQKLAAEANQPDYAYRLAGKKARDPNKVRKAEDILTKAVSDEAEKRALFGPAARMLPGADYVRANQLDALNRFAVRLTLAVAVILAGVEYLRRFNLTFGSILPMPIACRAIDSLWPKTHTVYLQTPDGRALRHYLQTAVQKGESFLCFAPEDPWPGERAAIDRLPIRGLWPLRKIVCRPGDPAYGSDLIFESAWYGRYCFVILADAFDKPLSALLGDILAALRMRRHTRAAAARTLNLAWHLPAPPPPETLQELAFLCRETNLKLVLASAQPLLAEASQPFEEVCAG
jgi:hypothetical protein